MAVVKLTYRRQIWRNYGRSYEPVSTLFLGSLVELQSSRQQHYFKLDDYLSIKLQPQ